MNLKRTTGFSLLLMALLVFSAGWFYDRTFAKGDDFYESIIRFDDIFKKIKVNYVVDVPAESLLVYAVNYGMRDILDPHTSYFEEKDYDNLMIHTKGEFGGLGITIGVPDNILLKPGSFNDAEWAVMKTHSQIGEKIIASTELEGSQKASKLIRHHHERFDGGGYPDRLEGERIPLCARIITITDSYDAMAMTRKYHTAKSHSEVMEILRQETGKKHDPELMAIFSEVIESSPLRAG